MTDRLDWLLPVICLLACFMTLWFESQDMQKHKFKTKLLASLAFVGFAWNLGAAGNLYGQILFAGLILSLIGDVLLALKNTKHAFILGIGAFLLAHVFYALAFSTMGSMTHKLAWVLPSILILLIGMGLWLRPYLQGIFQVAVPAYLLVIGCMLMMAWLVPNITPYIWIITGASLFALSDVFVARNRFIKSAMINRMIGLPLYYVSQLILAYSISAVSHY